MITIDIEQAFNTRKDFFLSDFVKHIEYVALDSKKPLDEALVVYSNDNYLICMAFEQIYLFDRQSGAFIREIGTVGRGPGEYKNIIYFDSETKRIIASIFGLNFIEYDLDGKMTRTIIKPRKSSIQIEDSGFDAFLDNNWLLDAFLFLDNNTLVYHNANFNGNAKDLLLIADEHGTVLKIYHNHYSFERIPNQITIINYRPLLYYCGGNILFYENCIDTIYRVTRDTLIPHFRLEMGKYKAPYEKRNDLPALGKYFLFKDMGETNRFLLFDFSHQTNPSGTSTDSFFGYYDKKNKKVKISDADGKQRHIINDIDHFGAIQFTRWTINPEKNELISYIEAIDIIEWFEQNPQQAKELPEHLQKLAALKPYDNPVVVIATLK